MLSTSEILSDGRGRGYMCLFAGNEEHQAFLGHLLVVLVVDEHVERDQPPTGRFGGALLHRDEFAVDGVLKADRL